MLIRMPQKEVLLHTCLLRISITNNIQVTFSSELHHRNLQYNSTLDPLSSTSLPISVLIIATSTINLMSKKERMKPSWKKWSSDCQRVLWAEWSMAMDLAILMGSSMMKQKFASKWVIAHHVLIKWKSCRQTRPLVLKMIVSPASSASPLPVPNTNSLHSWNNSMKSTNSEPRTPYSQCSVCSWARRPTRMEVSHSVVTTSQNTRKLVQLQTTFSGVTWTSLRTIGPWVWKARVCWILRSSTPTLEA